MIKKFINILFVVITVGFHSVFGYDFAPDNDFLTDSLILVNTDTNQSVFEKNADKRRSLASLTKIMSYIVVSENFNDLEAKITVKKEVLKKLDSTDSSLANLKDGDELSVKDLLYCMMISSGNDAALVLAEEMDGGVDVFVEKMNQKAQELQCQDTHFVNPHGLYDENHYSNCKDIVKIVKYAMQLPHFMEIVGTTRYNIFKDNRGPLVTTNKMIDATSGGEYYYKYAKGVKTGQFDEAGRCLASYAEKDGYGYICVALGAPKFDDNGKAIPKNYAMLDSKSLFIWAFDNFKIKEVFNTENPVTEIKINYAWRKNIINLVPENNLNAILPKNVNFDDLILKYDLPESIDTPIEKGDIIGSVKVSYEDKEIANLNLVSNESVSKSYFMVIFGFLNTFFTSKLFFVCLLILILFIVYTFLKINRFRTKRRRKSVYRRNTRSRRF